jgi:hypothetical protein
LGHADNEETDKEKVKAPIMTMSFSSGGNPVQAPVRFGPIKPERKVETKKRLPFKEGQALMPFRA